MENLRQQLPLLYDDMQQNMKFFKRESYQETFEAYMEKNSEVFTGIRQMMITAEDAPEDTMRDIAEAFCDCAAVLLEQANGRIAKESMQLNLNMITVIYIIPAIRESKSEQSTQLSEMLCEQWNARFKGSQIKTADFQSIQDGFRSKLCYITTAVCTSLQKPEDCYELTLLKQYRDNYLAEMPGGADLIQNYYNIAPTIVKRIGKNKKAEDTYRMIWEQYLSPCIALIEAQQHEACRRRYQEMVEKLHKEYMEEYYE